MISRLPWMTFAICCIGPLLVAIAFVAMMIASWGTWPDEVVDFGRELYVPWQITQGQVLYRDIAYFYGPLSPYVNTLCFMLMGVGLRSLVIVNLGVLVILIYLLYQVLVNISNRFAAYAACILFVLMFAFAEYVPVGNYNYVCPYSHAALYGLVLSIAAIFFLLRFQQRRRTFHAATCGFFLGLVFLTKPESFLAAVPAIALGLILIMWRMKNCAVAIKVAALVIGMAVLGPLIAFGLLRTSMSADLALRGVLGSWPYLFNSQLTSVFYFRQGMGTDDIGGNLRTMLIECGMYAAVFGPVFVVAMLLPKKQRVQVVCAFVAFAVVAAALIWRWQDMPYNEIARPLPLLMLVTGCVAVLHLKRNWSDAEKSGRAILQLVAAIFAFGMLLKMVLFTRLYHYGFILAMPASMILIMLLLDWIPNWLRARNGSGLFFQAVAVAVLGVAAKLHVQDSCFWYSKKSVTIGDGVDQFRIAPAHGAVFKRALGQLEALREGDSSRTLLVLPEGIMMNYLLRMPNPTPFITFLPSDFMMFGEDKMNAALQANSPDLFVFTSRNTAESGFAFFGIDYFQAVMPWLGQHYEQISKIEDPPPPGSGRYFIWIYLKKQP